MPTGYTSKLAEGEQDFTEFVLQCARGMGALVMMRDESLDAPIKEFIPSDFYEKRLAEARQEYARLVAMNDAERIAYGEAKKSGRIAHTEEWLAKEAGQNQRMSKMRDLVSAWNPPTSEHAGFKSFMLEQLDMSIDPPDYIQAEIAKAKAAFASDFYDTALRDAAESIPRYEDEHRKECERTEARNRWVRELKASLGLSDAGKSRAKGGV